MGTSKGHNYPRGWDDNDPKEIFLEFMDKYKGKHPFEESPDPVLQFLEVISNSSQDPDLQPYLHFFESLTEKPNQQQLVPLSQNADRVLYEQENRLPMLNPLLQATLAEQLQFDGDIPEMRTRLSNIESLSPAVPVQTESLSLTHIANQLEIASQEVKEEMSQNLKEVENFFLENPKALEKKESWELEKIISQRVEVEGYKTGGKPSLVKVEEKSSPLAALEVSQKSLEKVLYSSQGRRSLSLSLAENLQKRFTQKGFHSTIKEETRDPDHTYSWSFSLLGKGSVNRNFSFTENMLNILLARVVSENVKECFHFQIIDRSDISERAFSFELQIWEQE